MAIPKKLLKFLDENKVKYEVVEHRKVYTAHDSAKTQKIDPKTVVKTLVMKLDKDYALAMVPANKNLDKAKFKKLAKPAKKVDLAKEAWMKKNILGKVGATPPFGSLMKLPVYIDAPLLKNKELIVSSGEYTESIKIKTKDFEKLEPDFIKGSFSQKK
ncbi:MAG: YbaK/EbsC family protein [Patescibacteria group bacterium]